MRSIFIALILVHAAPGAVEDYFPLATGNEWTYRSERGEVARIQVGEAAEAGGRTYYRLDGYAPQPILVRRGDNGELVRWDEALSGEVTVTRFDGKFSSGAGFCREEGEVESEPGRFPAAGRTLSAVAIRYRINGCADAGIVHELYGANLGLLRRVSQSIAGPVQFDLFSARLGGVSFQAGAVGAVVVQLVRPELPRPAVGQPLRIQGSISVDVTGAGGPIDLEFRSAQRFNVVLVSKEGERLWTWSADKVFVAVTARESWSGPRSFDWDLTIPAEVASRLGEGDYRVEAWITASGQQIALSAAAPLRIGAVN